MTDMKRCGWMVVGINPNSDILTFYGSRHSSEKDADQARKHFKGCRPELVEAGWRFLTIPVCYNSEDLKT